MELFNIFALSILQGLTEFLPISSSAHLILLPKLTGWNDQGLAFDVAVHVGTLSAVVIYFRLEIISLINAWWHSIFPNKEGVRVTSQESKLAWGVIIATIPVGLAGLLLKSIIESDFRSSTVIASTTIIFGLLLWFADLRGKRNRDEYSLSWKDIVIIGVAQAIALIPGTSRSGITMTAGLLLGLTRKAAARFSFLISIPVIFLAGGLETVKLLQSDITVNWAEIFLGVGLSAISALLCIHFFLQFLERIGMLPFVIYRLLLGGLLFVMFV